MKIEKGKLYLDTDSGTIFKADMTTDNYPIGVSDKISVYCLRKEDFGYVLSVFKHCNHARPFVYINEEFGERHNEEGYYIITIDRFKEFYPPDSVISNKTDDNVQNTQPHYDNTHGSLYKIAEQRKWNSYQFDIVKRIDRALKKGQFKEDLQKTKDLIDLWLREESN